MSSKVNTIRYAGGCICFVIFLAGAAAITIAAIHGLPNTSGLDGERNYNNTQSHEVLMSTSTCSHARMYHDLAPPPASIEGDGEGEGADLLHNDHHEDHHNHSHHPINDCVVVIEGEFNFTLSIWLFTWGVGTVVVAVFACLGYFTGLGKGQPGRWLEGFAGFIAFFTWVPWAIVGLIFLVRKWYDIQGVSTDSWVYGFSIFALSVCFIVWFVASAVTSVNVGQADEAMASLTRNALTRGDFRDQPHMERMLKSYADDILGDEEPQTNSTFGKRQ
jgi:hypothetical protein